MSASLVGSEMCIRDSGAPSRPRVCPCSTAPAHCGTAPVDAGPRAFGGGTCLLYTSDAADDM
eukprot:12576745-Alexandrium_andersonii.AAC.1